MTLRKMAAALAAVGLAALMAGCPSQDDTSSAPANQPGGGMANGPGGMGNAPGGGNGPGATNAPPGPGGG